MSFRCNGCGLCCKHIDVAVKATEHIKELHFPYTWDETGRCDFLSEDNTCLVYDDRPLLCNVEKLAEHFNLDKEDFYKKNEDACVILQEENN